MSKLKDIMLRFIGWDVSRVDTIAKRHHTCRETLMNALKLWSSLTRTVKPNFY